MNLPMKQWNGSEATDRLHETVVQLHRESSRQGTTILWVAVASLVVSILGLVVAVVTLYATK